MKYAILVSSFLMTGFFIEIAQVAALAKAVSMVNIRQPEPAPSKSRMPTRDRLKMGSDADTTAPKNRKQRRLNPDSLRKGGATRVDTVRR